MAGNNRHEMLKSLVATFSRGTQAEPGAVNGATEVPAAVRTCSGTQQEDINRSGIEGLSGR